MAVEGKHQVIPGEIEFDLEQTRRTQGLPLPEELVKDLRAMDDLLGIGRHLAIQ